MIHFLLGTRAQLIKMAPLMIECKSREYKYNFVYLAQHKETISDIIRFFDLGQPDITIGDLNREISSIKLMARWLAKVVSDGIVSQSKIFQCDKSGVAVVHGDALPALLGAVMAKRYGLRVAHVEAGLRSYSFADPFPEELIRVMLWEFGLVDYFFCPDQRALGNVQKYAGEKINTSCNTVVDALRITYDRLSNSSRQAGIDNYSKYGIVTLHRYETLSNRRRMVNIVNILTWIAKKIKLFFVLHPATHETLVSLGLLHSLNREPGIMLVKRLDYLDFIALLKKSEFVISDGGGNQEECSYLGHPCLLLRSCTERPHGIGENAVLSNFDRGIIEHFVDNYSSFRRPAVLTDFSPSKLIIDKLEATANHNHSHESQSSPRVARISI